MFAALSLAIALAGGVAMIAALTVAQSLRKASTMKIHDSIEITEEMALQMKKRTDMLQLLMGKSIGVTFGPHFKHVLVLAMDGDPDSLCIMSDVDTNEQAQEILRSAIARSNAGVMVCQSELEAKLPKHD